MMAAQGGNPSIIDKMTLFWQNHFVTTEANVDEFRAIYKYFMKVRSRSLENFKDFVRDITFDPAMLKFLNGHDNQKGTGGTASNENYARELQELFVVGGKDFAGNNNYTENDVKAAARVLRTSGSIPLAKSFASCASFTALFPSRRDASDAVANAQARLFRALLERGDRASAFS